MYTVPRAGQMGFYQRTEFNKKILKIEGKTIYHAGDTDFIPEMKELGKVDVALIPTGDKYTMDNVEAAEAAGGDIRGRQSAAMVVVSGKPTGQSWRDNLVDRLPV
jgi:L-ascorbate metabolism protein UlaG (beta-lactamase superfamily)